MKAQQQLKKKLKNKEEISKKLYQMIVDEKKSIHEAKAVFGTIINGIQQHVQMRMAESSIKDLKIEMVKAPEKPEKGQEKEYEKLVKDLEFYGKAFKVLDKIGIDEAIEIMQFMNGKVEETQQYQDTERTLDELNIAAFTSEAPKEKNA